MEIRFSKNKSVALAIYLKNSILNNSLIMKIYNLFLIAIVSIFLISCNNEDVTVPEPESAANWHMTKYRLTNSQTIINPGEVTWSFNETNGMLEITNNLEPQIPYYTGEYPYTMTTDTLIFTYEGDSNVFKVTPHEGELIVFIDPDPNIFDDGYIFHFVEE